MTLALTGHAVSRGIAIGQTHLAERNELEIGEYLIQPDAVESEVLRFRTALAAASEQLEALSARVGAKAGTPASEIIQVHIQLLADSAISAASEQRIRTDLFNAE